MLLCKFIEYKYGIYIFKYLNMISKTYADKNINTCIYCTYGYTTHTLSLLIIL